MNQQPLFPVTVTQLIPNSGGSADIRYFAVGDDGLEYAAKESLIANPSLPAAEYLGYCFAATCHVAVPACALLNMPDGTEAFGSRFEGGINTHQTLMPNEQIQALKDCSSQLSALLAVDLFLANDDRHQGNFLLRKGGMTGQWGLIAIDFSRSMWFGGFPTQPVQLTATSGNTAVTIEVMKRIGLWDNARSALAISTVASITGRQYSSWVAALPKAWVTGDVSFSVTWWNSSDRTLRVSDVLGCL